MKKELMKYAFLTGSQVYGKPTLESDIDLVVLMSGLQNIEPLIRLSDRQVPCNADDYGSSLYFGKLNLICMYDEEKFDTWWNVTQDLSSCAPVTREEAKKAIISAGGS